MKLGKPSLARTYFIDIDGCVLKHRGKLSQMLRDGPEATPHTVESLDRLLVAGHTIILTTARPEPCRARTEEQLRHAGIVYHRLLMGIPHGSRIIINDLVPGSDDPTCAAASVQRDAGLTERDLFL